MAKVIHKFQNITQYKTKKYVNKDIVDLDKSSEKEKFYRLIDIQFFVFNEYLTF